MRGHPSLDDDPILVRERRIPCRRGAEVAARDRELARGLPADPGGVPPTDDEALDRRARGPGDHQPRRTSTGQAAVEHDLGSRRVGVAAIGGLGAALDVDPARHSGQRGSWTDRPHPARVVGIGVRDAELHLCGGPRVDRPQAPRAASSGPRCRRRRPRRWRC